MQEKTLLRIALLTSIIGLSLLFIISQETELIEFINNGDSGTIKGVVTSVRKTDKTTILGIDYNVKGVVFEQGYLDLEKGDKIEIRGDLNQKEIIIDEIRII